MTPRKTTLEVLLIGLAAFIFLLAALALFLLQQPHSPSPWAAASTVSQAVFSTHGATMAIGSSPPTRTPRTSYTPFATRLTLEPEANEQVSTQEPTPAGPTISPDPRTPSPTPTPDIPYPGVQPTPTTALLPGTPSPTPTSTSSPTFSPTATLAQGEIGISGRVVLNGVPVSGVNVTFRDDQPPRSAVTDSLGRYWFTTYAIGIDFLLSFEQATNLQYSPGTPVASTAILYGYLPSSNTVITLPDLEISLIIAGQSFEPTIPIDGATFSAVNITSSNPLQFVWTTYNQSEYYYVELFTATSDELLWGSEDLTSTNVMFAGILDDATQITAGTYNWYVTANRQLNGYMLTIYTQPRSLVITP